MTDILFTHKLPTETAKDVAAASRDFYLDARTAKDSTPKDMEAIKATLKFPEGLRFTLQSANYKEGDPVHQMDSYAKVRSVAFGSSSKGNLIRTIEPGTEKGGEVLLHPGAYITAVEAAA